MYSIGHLVPHYTTSIYTKIQFEYHEVNPKKASIESPAASRQEERRREMHKPAGNRSSYEYFHIVCLLQKITQYSIVKLKVQYSRMLMQRVILFRDSHRVLDSVEYWGSYRTNFLILFLDYIAKLDICTVAVPQPAGVWQEQAPLPTNLGNCKSKRIGIMYYSLLIVIIVITLYV